MNRTDGLLERAKGRMTAIQWKAAFFGMLSEAAKMGLLEVMDNLKEVQRRTAEQVTEVRKKASGLDQLEKAIKEVR